MIKTQHCPNCEAQAAEIERLRVEARAQYDRGYYDGCTQPIVRHDALKIARERITEWCDAVAVEWGQGSQTHNVARDGRDIVLAALRQPQTDALAHQLLQECLVKLRDVQGTQAPKQYACNLIKRIERVLQEQSK